MTGLTSRRKGNRREREAADIYEAAGYRVERATAGGFQSPDFFDLFDLMAVITGRGMDLVQVRSNGARGIEQWCEDTLPFQTTLGLCPAMVVAYDNEGWRLVIPTGGDSHVTLYDEREEDCKMGEGLTEYLSEQFGEGP